MIELVRGGTRLSSRPLGLSLFDGTNGVLIAELKSSIGQVLPSGTGIIYTNVFTDQLGCDLVADLSPPQTAHSSSIRSAMFMANRAPWKPSSSVRQRDVYRQPPSNKVFKTFLSASGWRAGWGGRVWPACLADSAAAASLLLPVASLQYTDTVAPGFVQRFYRAAWSP